MRLDPARIHGHGPRCPCDHCAWQMRRATAAYWLTRGLRALAGIEPIRTEEELTMQPLAAIDTLLADIDGESDGYEEARAALAQAIDDTRKESTMPEATATTIGAGLPLTSDAYARPPLNIPADDGRPYKTELVVSRSPERTVKINWWHGPDDAGSRARPHSHPWDFTSTVLHGAITHTRYLLGVGGTPPAPRIIDSTETIRAGESYVVLASEYHLVTAVEPGTVTMMECGPLGGTEPHAGGWGYLDVTTGEHVPATADPDFRARLAAANPWMTK